MLDGYVSEKEQLESIKTWWDDNGRFVLIAIFIGLAIGFGWRYWNKVQTQYAENAAMIFQTILDADKKNDFPTAQGRATTLEQHFDRAPYASLAAMIWAKEAVGKNDLATATTQLQWALEHAKQERVKQIAALSLARIYLSQKKTQAALALLANTDDKQFEPLVDWIKGDIFSQQGDITHAKTYYAKAKTAFTEFPPAEKLLTQQLAN